MSETDGSAGAARLFVPGRIEVLGKHTDYAGGRSLLCAIDRGFTVTVEAMDAPMVTVLDTGREERVEVPLGDGTAGRHPAASAAPGWAVYPRAVVRRVASDFPGRLRGCAIELSSDLPAAAGLSSSSAFMTAVFLALDQVSRISETDRYHAAIPDRPALAGYLGAVERGSPFPGLEIGSRADPDVARASTPGVGTRGGSQDHVAILCAEPDRLVRYAFEPVRKEGAVDLPRGRTFVIGVSGVHASKTGPVRERYNRLSDRASRAAAVWRSVTGGDEPHLGAILATRDGFERLRDAIEEGAGDDERDDLLRRVRHFAAESAGHVPAAAEALAAADLERFGDIAARSQTLAERLLENQVPETVHLARSAREAGAIAASAFGAGFGGAVWAYVPTSDAMVFLNDWRTRYRAAFPERAESAVFFTTRAAGPAHAV